MTMSRRGEDELEEEEGATEEDVESEGRGVLRMAQEPTTKENEQPDQQDEEKQQPDEEAEQEEQLSVRKKDLRDGRVVDVVLSDMSAPWEQTSGYWIRSVSNPYLRMMNTSGTAFRDHAGSMVSLFVLLHFSFLYSLLSLNISTIPSLSSYLQRVHWLKQRPFSTGRIFAMLP